MGALTFVAAHAVEVRRWHDWFGQAHDPWFLNSGRGATFTVGCLFAAGLLGGLRRLPGSLIVAGAATAMTAVLVSIGSTIFPIAFAAGFLLLASAVLLGAWIGREVAGLSGGRGDS